MEQIKTTTAIKFSNGTLLVTDTITKRFEADELDIEDMHKKLKEENIEILYVDLTKLKKEGI